MVMTPKAVEVVNLNGYWWLGMTHFNEQVPLWDCFACIDDIDCTKFCFLSIAKTTQRLIIRWLLNYEAKYICFDYFSCI